MPLSAHLGFLAAGVLAGWLLTPLVRALALRLGVLDRPGGRKLHGEPKPLLGGLAVFAGFYGTVFGALALGLAFRDRLPLPLQDYLRNIAANEGAVLLRLGAIAAGGAAMFALGLADDLRNLRVGTRLAVQTAVAAAVVLAGVRPELGFLPLPAAWAAGVVWIVAVTNAFNFIDGLDGEAAGVGAIAAAVLGAAMTRWHHPLVSTLLWILAGTLLGFLRWNFPPARIFLGNAGSLLIGYLLSAIALVSTFIVHPRTDVLPVVMPVLVMGLPLYDMLSVFTIRKLSGAPLTVGDRNHLGHRLMRRGFTEKQAVLCIYALTFCVSLNALLLPVAGVADSLVILAQGLAVLGVVVLLERIRAREG